MFSESSKQQGEPSTTDMVRYQIILQRIYIIFVNNTIVSFVY